jgi:hypothetical protein
MSAADGIHDTNAKYSPLGPLGPQNGWLSFSLGGRYGGDGGGTLARAHR